MDTGLVLTIPEIAALSRAVGDAAARIAEGLGIGDISDEVAMAGLSSLYARGFLEVAEGETRPVPQVAAAIDVVAVSGETISMVAVSPDESATSRLLVADQVAVLVTPIALGCLEFRFVDMSSGVAAVVQVAGEAALSSDDTIFLVSSGSGDDGVSVAVRRQSGEFGISDSETGVFESVSADAIWGLTFDRLDL